LVGHVDPQRDLFTCDNQYLDFVGADTFYAYLARHGSELFSDDDFSAFYTHNNGRTSVPPSLLAKALLLQCYDRASDEETTERARYDLRWKVALGIGIDDAPFAKSTLQTFRAQLLLSKMEQLVFRRSIETAKAAGLLGRRKLNVVLDTTPVFGRGAVKDTYNLLADGIRQLVRVLAGLSGQLPERWAQEHDLGRYYGSSLKGEAEIDWDDACARQAFLDGIVADAERLLAAAARVRAGLEPGGPVPEEIERAAGLLRQLLVQDVERAADGQATLKQGVARDRIASVTDPEMRHGRKSASGKFTGYKAAIAVEPKSLVITAVAVLPGNAPDRQDALELVQQTSEHTGGEVEKVIGDCAYGDGATRRAFRAQGRQLVAKVPSGGRPGYYAKGDFRIELEHDRVTCPVGQTTERWRRKRVSTGKPGERVMVKEFRFAAEQCRACAHYRQCVSSKRGKGRSVVLHPEEALLQEARAYQETAAFREDLKSRQTAEHRLARLVQLGIRKARYFGRAKTRWQVLLAAAVANLVLVAAWGLRRGPDHGGGMPLATLLALLFCCILVRRAAVEVETGFARLRNRFGPIFSRPTPGFRPDF